jgi:hypothetical protein
MLFGQMMSLRAWLPPVIPNFEENIRQRILKKGHKKTKLSMLFPKH